MNSISTTQTVTATFFSYKGLNKLWGMKQMYSARAPMRAMRGMEFFKPLGTGSGLGYSLWPDFSTYGMLGVWKDESCAEEYLESALMKNFVAHSAEVYTVVLKPISSRGAWSGFSGWKFSDPNPENPIICALTRATLKPSFLFKFWSMVPGVSRKHGEFNKHIFTKGIGEIPFMEQATFSIWPDAKSMEEFAYQHAHGEAVTETRRRNGFKEEMFTRLKPYKTLGTWRGTDPVGEYLLGN